MGNTGTATAPPSARAGTVDVLVGLLAELDEATESGVFYDRVCRAVCTLTTMRRAALLLHDDAYGAVIPVGSHGLDPELLQVIEGTLDETPIARRAFEEDRVVEVTGSLAAHVPPRYAELAGTETLTCTPISAARRWLGVIFADRGGEAFQLDDGERETMETLGRLAALTASVERSTEHRASERRLVPACSGGRVMRRKPCQLCSVVSKITQRLNSGRTSTTSSLAASYGSRCSSSAPPHSGCQPGLR